MGNFEEGQDLLQAWCPDHAAVDEKVRKKVIYARSVEVGPRRYHQDPGRGLQPIHAVHQMFSSTNHLLLRVPAVVVQDETQVLHES